MELNASFLKKLEDKSRLIDGDKLSAEEKIALLCKYGDEGKNVGMKINGEYCYSFLSEDTLYRKVFGMGKSDYELTKDPDYVNQSKFKHEKYRYSFIYSKQWKPELKKHLDEKHIEGLERIVSDTLNGNDYRQLKSVTNSVHRAYTILSMMKPNAALYHATSYYATIGDSAKDRLDDELFMYLLINSKGAENFSRVLADDVDSVYGVTDGNLIFEILNERVTSVENKIKELNQKQPGAN